MQTVYLPEIWYKLDYDVEESCMNFKAYRIESVDEENTGLSVCKTTPDIEGSIKWDGCVNFTQDAHYCELEHAEQTLALFKTIYKLAQENIPNSDIPVIDEYCPECGAEAEAEDITDGVCSVCEKYYKTPSKHI